MRTKANAHIPAGISGAAICMIATATTALVALLSRSSHEIQQRVLVKRRHIHVISSLDLFSLLDHALVGAREGSGSRGYSLVGRRTTAHAIGRITEGINAVLAPIAVAGFPASANLSEIQTSV